MNIRRSHEVTLFSGTHRLAALARRIPRGGLINEYACAA
jgi:hypothetical protein